MKQERLLAITTHLLSTRHTTAKELAERFGVSVRTIYRDIDLLSSAGVPVFATQGTGGGISLMEGYTLDRIPLGEGERDALLLGAKALTATKHPFASAALDKLAALYPTHNRDWITVDFADYGLPSGLPSTFALAQQAILDARLLSFTYDNAKRQRTTRTVEPLRLWYRGMAWYLWAYCLHREDHRLFRLSRIQNPQVSAEGFDHNAHASSYDDMLATIEQEESRPLTTLRLLFHRRAMHRMTDYTDHISQHETADGWYHATVTFPEDEWVYGWLLSFGADLVVEEPTHIRTLVAERHTGAAKLYEEDAHG